MPLSEVHQLLVQSCLSRRAFSEKTGEAIYQHIVTACQVANGRAPSYSEALDDVNAAIEPFGFMIKRFLDEHSGKPWTAFVNIRSDEIAKVATEYSPHEISYFRTLIKGIMRSGKRYAIPTMQAKTAGNSDTVSPKLKPSEAEKVLRTFVAKGWLIAVPATEGRQNVTMYQLSSRARMELEHYLIEQYPRQMDKDYECKKCNEIVMNGMQCPTPDCKMRMHHHCARAAQLNRKACPECKKDWNAERALQIGPNAPEGDNDASSDDSEPEEEDGAAERAARSSEAPASEQRRKSKGKGRAPPSDADGMDADEIEEPEEPAPARSRGRTTAATKKGGLGDESEEEKKVKPASKSQQAVKADDEDEEEDEDELDAGEDDDDDDPLTQRRKRERQRAQERKKRKATGQPAR